MPFQIRLAVIVTILCLTVLSTAFAAGIPLPEDKGFYFAFEYRGFRYYLWDQDSSESGQAKEFWVKMVPTASGREAIARERRQVGLPPGAYADVTAILCRTVFSGHGRQAKFLVDRQIYFTGPTAVLASWHRADMTVDRPPALYIAGECERFFLGLNNSTVLRYEPSDFCGIRWGTRPEAIPGLRSLGRSLVSDLAIYEGEVDTRRLLGDLRSLAPARLAFADTRGLVMGSLLVAGSDYAALLAHLSRKLGPPAASTDAGACWFVEQPVDGKIVCVSPALTGHAWLVRVVEPAFWHGRAGN
jgi:hypothetical protein